MRRNLRYLVKGAMILSISLPLIFWSCGKKHAPAPPPAKVKVVEVIQTTVPVPNEFVGQSYGYRDIPIRARVDGFLTGIYFKEGSLVRKGELLYTIDPEPLKAAEAMKLSALAEAQTRLVKAESDLKRVRPLAEINAVSQRDLDAAIAEYEAAKARVEAEEAQVAYARINLSYTRLSSPIDGIIGMTQAKPGEYVGKSPNPIVLNEVSSIDTILVNFNITEAEFLGIMRNYLKQKELAAASGDEAKKGKASISLLLSDGSLYHHPGRVNFLDRQIDPSTGTITVQASFPNPEGLLRPGQFARVRVILEEIEGGLLIPQRCIRELQGIYQVLVVNDSNKVDLRQVKMGAKVGGMWLVEAGLQAGERVVFEGLNMVRPGQSVEPLKADIPAELMKF